MWPAVLAACLVLGAITAILVVAGPGSGSRAAVGLPTEHSGTGSVPPGGVSPDANTSAPASTDATPTATAMASATPASPSPTKGMPKHFSLIAPGGALPTGAQCATWVRATAYPETKGANARANQTTGHHIDASFFHGDDPRASTSIGTRVDGQFTGTTWQILRWTACKWGIDEDVVMAQAAAESWWQQNALGDWTTDSSRCAPGHSLGVDGRDGQCPESFGILQNRYPYEQSAWPGIASSTAMNADVGYAIWRTCFEGYEGWLNTVARGRDYAAGDQWGCIGRLFSGRWYTSPSQTYVVQVRDYLSQRVWEKPSFRQP
jgi:hypothetical protein